MPLTQIDFPILARFLCVVEMTTGQPTLPQQQDDGKPPQQPQQQALPQGMVLGPDGKPCRTCTSGAQWRAMMSKSTSISKPAQPQSQPALPSASTTDDCPPDVEVLGRSTWTLLHSLTAQYPTAPTPERQRDTKQFLSLFSRFYPCWVCAEDFQSWMREGGGNEPRVSNREDFGRWMCEAHNAVNVKLGKEKFDCNRWEERWRTGWRDGRCD